MPTTVLTVTLSAHAIPAAVQFAANLSQHGDRVAITTADEAITYDELARRADAVADRLGGGVGRRLVLLPGANTPEVVAGYLGALRGGHVPLLVPGGQVDLHRIEGTFDPDVVMELETGGRLGVTERRSGSAHDLHPDLALLLGTSGSTGVARTVRLSHGNLEANAASIASYLALDADDRAAMSLPVHYCYGLSVLHSHLSCGAGVTLTDRSVVDPCFWDLFRSQRCTSFAGVPYTFELLDRIAFDRLSLPTLRYVTQAGGRLDPETVRRYAGIGARDGWDLVVMYGQTEATARMAYLPPHLAASRPGAIGVAIPGGSLEIDPTDGADPDEGELVYRGPNVMLGYATDRAHLALGRTVEVLRTGDLARRAPDGLFEIVGRTSRFAKIAGLRIDLDDVEAGLREAGFVTLCASDDRRLVIGVAGPVTDLARVADAAMARCGLPHGRVTVVPFDELPRLTNGKPDVERVRAAARETSAVGVARLEAPDPAADPSVHPAVRALLIDVLRVATVVGDDTFVSLGGDSLSYVEVSIGLEALVGDLPSTWHVTPLSELVPRSDVAPGRRGARIETSILVRALAIVLIVGNHVGVFQLLGGAHALLGVSGWNFARFERGPRDRLRSVARIAVPSMVWLAIAALTVTPRIDLDHVLLLHGWIGDRGAHGGYWYIEAIVPILVALTLLLAVPPVARVARGHPFGTPLALAIAGLLLRFGIVDVPTPEPHDIRPHDIFWLFALGWAGAQARTLGARLLVSGLLLAALPGYFDEGYRGWLVLGAMLAVLWVPTIRVPRVLVRPVAHLAAASLAIYLTHWQVFPPVRDALGRWPALAVALVAGVGVWWAVTMAARGIATRRGRPAVAGSDVRDAVALG